MKALLSYLLCVEPVGMGLLVIMIIVNIILWL